KRLMPAAKWHSGAIAVLAMFCLLALAQPVSAKDESNTKSNPDIQTLHQRADAGDMDAMYLLGYDYEHGGGVVRDYHKAMKWYRQAAANGDVAALDHIGVLYLSGHGVKQDSHKAMQWFHKAAAKGDAIAMTNIGALYEHGQGVKRDYRKAMHWFSKATD